MVKTNSLGIQEWYRTFGGGLEDIGYGIQQTGDGGYIIVGSTNSYGYGEEDVYFIKTDSNGSLSWTYNFGGNNSDVGKCIQKTNDGGFILVGCTYSFGSGGADIYLIKTNSTGDTLWTRCFGGADEDVGNFVQQTSDNGYFITGRSGGWPYGDIYLVKTDSNGNEQWHRTYGFDNYDEGFCGKQTVDGGYIITGEIRQNWGDYDLYILKLNANGDMEWEQVYSFWPSTYDYGYSVIQSSDGGYYIVGRTSWPENLYFSDLLLMKTNSLGDSIWTNIYGAYPADEGKCIQNTNDGGYVIVGYTESYGGTGGRNIWLLKTESDHISLSLTPLNMPILIQPGGGSFNLDIEITNNAVIGYTIDFNTFVVAPSGSSIPVLQRNNISLLSGTSITRYGLRQFVPGTALSGTYDYYAQAYDHNTWVLLAEDSFEFEKLAGNDYTVYDHGWTLIGWDEEDDILSSIQVEYAFHNAYPNPFNPVTKLEFDLYEEGKVKLTIYDIQGREIAKLVDGWYSAGSHQITFDASQLASGLYFARLIAGDFQQTLKLLLIK